MGVNNLNTFIDHTQLKPETTTETIEQLCQEAIEYKFKAVCVNSTFIPQVNELLQGHQIEIASVVGFPLGASLTEVKAYEAEKSTEYGATEIDMVINIGALKDSRDKEVAKDIETVVKNVPTGTIVKVILENCLLTDEEKIKACEISKRAGAHYVKTSTGFSSGGAAVSDIQLMRKIVGEQLGVKASGGIRDKKTAEQMIEAGATRIGASKSVQIVSS